MNEVEKMYRNCKIKKQYCGWLDMGDLDTQYTYVRCNSLKEFNDTAMMSRTSYSSEEEDWDKPSIEYPPFTPEKQIELIKLLQRKNGYKFSPSSTNDNSEYLFFAHKDNTPVQELIVAGDKCYEEALAGFINALWQDLTDTEKVQIKEILNNG